MNRFTQQTLDSNIERLAKFLTPQEVTNEEKYRYYLVLKQSGEFLIFALQKDRDIYIVKTRYNAPVCIELTIHEYFEYSYIFYDGCCKYWNMPKGEINTKSSIKRLKN